MSFIYAKDRNYPIYNIGDEVYTDRTNWKGIEPYKPYTVLNCFKKPGLTIDIYVIVLKTDIGYESEYASYKFKKTKRQLREEKINQIINSKI